MKNLRSLRLLMLAVLSCSSADLLAVETTDARKIKMSAFVGEHDAKLSFDVDVSGVELYRSKNSDCDISDIYSCESGQFDVLNNQPITDTVFSVYTGITGKFVFKEGDRRADVSFEGAPLGGRQDHQVVFFNSRLMTFGGVNSISKRTFPFMFYSMDNGTRWMRDMANGSYLPGYGDRVRHRMIVFKNKLWMIGGGAYSGDGPATNNDVWSSIDGSDWKQETQAADFTMAEGFDIAVFEGRLWVIGTQYGGDQSQIWSSENGVEWQMENDAPAFGGRSMHQVEVLNGKMWLIGGRTSDGPQNDIWSSLDGKNWTLENASAEFTPRFSHQVTVHDDALFLVGGREDSFQNYVGYQKDVWRSEDGVQWNKIGEIPFGGRAYHQLVSTGDKLVVTAGSREVWRIDRVIESIGDSWISDDGVEWSLATHDPAFGERKSQVMVEFNDKLWLFGGQTYDVYKREIWSSEDGLTWKLMPASLPADTMSSLHTFVHDGRVWIMDRERNYSGEGSQFNFWSSSDALNWREEGAVTGVPASFDVTSYDGQIFITYREFDEVITRTSENSLSWEEARAQLPAGFPFNSEITVFKDKLWSTGGYVRDANNDPSEVSDVWSSVDGLVWALETNSAWNRGRWLHEALVHDGRLWVIGGRNEAGLAHNESWSSADGVSWIEHEAGMGFRPQRGHKALSFKGQLVVFAGVEPLGYFNSDNYMWVYDTDEWRKGYLHEFDLGVTHYDLRTAETENGSIAPATQSIAAGEAASFEIIPAEGYMIGEVFGCDGELAGNTFTRSAVVSDCTLGATFVPGPVVVTTRVKWGRGTITPEYSEVPEGTILTLTVTADDWYAPSKVEGCNGTWLASKGTYTVGPLLEDCEVTATFRWDWW